jgi:asparagine synthase (glutamine-hydrolysing)
MLYKVDLMSMASGLEVRVPFLDHRLVEMAMSIPEDYKIKPHQAKALLRDILAEYIPGRLSQRSKHGFEVPLLNWFRNELKTTIQKEVLEPSFIHDQGIFDEKVTSKLVRKLFTVNPGDSHAHIWALIVFQAWWKKYFNG